MHMHSKYHFRGQVLSALRGVKNSSNSAEKEETESHMEHRITTRFMSGRVEMEMSVDQCLTLMSQSDSTDLNSCNSSVL